MRYVLVVVLVFQLFLAALINDGPAGLTVGSMLGVFVGIVWHKLVTKLWLSKARVVAAYFVFFMIPGASYLTYLQYSEWTALKTLHSLVHERVKCISIVDNTKGHLLWYTSDPTVVREFAIACIDAQSYSPAHAMITDSWLLIVDVDDTDRLKIEINAHKYQDNLLFGTFLRPHATAIVPIGHFESSGLAHWFNQYVRKHIKPS